MGFFRGFVICCSQCGHRNRPHKSPRQGIRLAILGKAGACRGCGKMLNPRIPDRPLTHKVLAELAAEGIKPVQRIPWTAQTA